MSNVKTAGTQQNDSFMEVSHRALEWVGQNFMALLAAFVAVAVLGGAWAGWNLYRESRETQWQEQYFPLEKALAEKKRSFDEAANPRPPVKGQAAPVGVKASGDLKADYGAIPQQLSDLIQAAPNSRAAEMAALTLADLQENYKQPAEALTTLGRVNTSSRVDALLDSLVVNKRASLMATQGDCKGAMPL